MVFDGEWKVCKRERFIGTVEDDNDRVNKKKRRAMKCSIRKRKVIINVDLGSCRWIEVENGEEENFYEDPVFKRLVINKRRVV